jgi:hypothetical protein
MDEDTLFDVSQLEETPTSPVTTEQQTTPTPAATPPTKPEDNVLETIRSGDPMGGKKLALVDGKVVAQTVEPRTKVDDKKGTDTQQPAVKMVELTVDGEKMMVPEADLPALAQQGVRFTQKTQALAEKEKQLEKQFQEILVTALTKQQVPAEKAANTAPDDDDDVTSIMAAMKAKFGKDDPDYEFDPLDTKQNAHFIRLNQQKVIEKANEDRKKEQIETAEAHRAEVLTNWEAGQRAADPDYDTVITWAMNNTAKPGETPVPLLKTLLNAQQYDAMSKAYAEGNTDIIEKGFTYVKKLYQKQKLGLTTTKARVEPPVVQPTGNGAPPVKTTTKRDVSKLAAMDTDERVAWIKENVYSGKT